MPRVLTGLVWFVAFAWTSLLSGYPFPKPAAASVSTPTVKTHPAAGQVPHLLAESPEWSEEESEGTSSANPPDVWSQFPSFPLRAAAYAAVLPAVWRTRLPRVRRLFLMDCTWLI